MRFFLAVQPKHWGNQNKMAARSVILHLILMKLCDKIENASVHIYTKSGMIKTMDVDFKDAVQYEPCAPSYCNQADKTKWRLDRPFLQRKYNQFFSDCSEMHLSLYLQNLTQLSQ